MVGAREGGGRTNPSSAPRNLRVLSAKPLQAGGILLQDESNSWLTEEASLFREEDQQLACFSLADTRAGNRAVSFQARRPVTGGRTDSLHFPPY